jgi:hypothetical protein
MISKYFTVGNGEKEMVFQLGSQPNIQFISTISLGKDIRYLKADLKILTLSHINITAIV